MKQYVKSIQKTTQYKFHLFSRNDKVILISTSFYIRFRKYMPPNYHSFAIIIIKFITIPILVVWKTGFQSHKMIPIELQVSTWSKDSHGLFDYEGKDNKFQIQKHDLKESLNIYRHSNKKALRTVFQQVVDEKKGQKRKQLPMENVYICSLVFNKEKNSCWIQSADVSGIEPHPMLKEEHPDLFRNSYLVLRDYLTSEGVEGYPLKSGNILRLGRVEFLVIEVNNHKGLTTLKETSHLQLNKSIYQVKGQMEGTCKVCLCEQSTEDDPLINPCNCKGSCEFIHVGCLKNWMFSKIKKEIVGVATTYNFSKLQCEICKVILPKTIKLTNCKLVDMISLQKPQKPYLILESLNDKDVKEQKKERNLHLLCPGQNQKINLGRGHQCQIRLTDISVSRTHSEIRYENGQFYVKDLNSKFGTLIKFRQQLELKDKIRLQHGRTTFEFRLKKATEMEEKQQEPEEIPVFYTRAQLRQMGELLEDDQDQY